MRACTRSRRGRRLDEVVERMEGLPADLHELVSLRREGYKCGLEIGILKQDVSDRA